MVGVAGGYMAIYDLFGLYKALFILAVLDSSSDYSILGAFAFFGSLVGLISSVRSGRKADQDQAPKTLRGSVIVESIDNTGRLLIAQFSSLTGLIWLAPHSLMSWWSYKARNVPVYRRAYQLSEQFPDAKVEYSVCLENLGILLRLSIFVAACLLSLVFSLSTTLLIGIAFAFVLNSVFLIPLNSPKVSRGV